MSEFTTEHQVQELERLLRATQRRADKAVIKQEAMVEAVYKAAYEASRAAGRVKPLPKAKRDKRKGKPEVALIHATDWQLGKKSVSYGMETCAQRIERFTEKVMHLTDIQRSHHPVDEAVLIWSGDMVEGGGNIFPSQIHEIEAHLFEQLFECVKIMETQVRTLAAYFPKLRIVCEYGNHGRLGRYGDGTYAGDNADRMAYKITQMQTRDLSIEWQMSDDWYQICEIGNYRALVVHGDEIKGYGGNVPAFGILRKCNAWASGVIEPFVDAYMGHFHTPMSLTMANGGRVFVTGSPESHNEYAREFVAATGKPSQRLHFVDPVAGRVTSEFMVWL
jgi:hypothetical protein